jgi:hypothetical protein
MTSTITEIGITISNYRCFCDSSAVSLWLKGGFTSFIGVNNSGKSSLLRFFFKLRELFRALTTPSNELAYFLIGKQALPLALPATVLDPQEIFCNRNTRDISIEIDFLSNRHSPPSSREPARVLLHIDRRLAVTASLYDDMGRVVNLEKPSFDGNSLLGKGGVVMDCTGMFAALKSLVDCQYIGSFRNALGGTVGGSYFYGSAQESVGRPERWGFW